MLGAKGVTRRYHELLRRLNLPELPTLLNSPPKTQTLKTYIRKNLALRAHVEFLETHESSFLGSCELHLLKPAPHWGVTVGDPALTRLNNFRIRLLVGCDGLEHDAARFRHRTTGATPSDPSCKLCGHEKEDAIHFAAVCPRLDDARCSALAEAPPIANTVLPHRGVDPRKFTEIILGTRWIEDSAFQCFCISFLSKLKTRRADLLFSGPV